MNPIDQSVFLATAMLAILLFLVLLFLVIVRSCNGKSMGNDHFIDIVTGMFMLMLGLSIQAFRYDFRLADALTIMCFIIAALAYYRFAFYERKMLR